MILHTWNQRLHFHPHLHCIVPGAGIAENGRYVCRTAIGDSRLVAVTDTHVSFRYKDRANGDAVRIENLEGAEFVRRYLRHVLPRGLRAIRHYGFCHPAAHKKRERVAFQTGRPLIIGAPAVAPEKPARVASCPCCGGPMRKLLRPATRVERKLRSGFAGQTRPSASPNEGPSLRMTRSRTNTRMMTGFFRPCAKGNGEPRPIPANQRFFPPLWPTETGLTPFKRAKSNPPGGQQARASGLHPVCHPLRSARPPTQNAYVLKSPHRHP